MSDFKMFVIGHKKIPVKLPKDYVPIQVGKNNTGLELHYIEDNSGDNISDKNSNYCELTAIYWLWKNYELPKYVGICHYRRFFVDGLFVKFLNCKRVLKIMRKKQVILPNEYHTRSTVYNHYFEGSGREKDLILLRDIIKDKYPNYLEEYDAILNSESTSYCNMCVLNKDDFCEYCEWLFDILFQLEKEIDLTGYSTQELRVFGYLSEFLLDVWVKKKNYSIYNCPVYIVKDNKLKSLLYRIKLGLDNIKKYI